MPAGFRVGPPRPSVAPDLIARYAAIPVANICDACHRLFGGVRLRPLGPARMTGPAMTVRTAPGDNLMVHKALQIALPGSILVVDASGGLGNAIIGERMAEIAVHRGLAGIVINGAVRDAEALKVLSIPVFAAGITARGPYKNGPGEINYPIAIDGMVIESGDLIAADEDGVVCVPHRDAADVCVLAERKMRAETENSPLKESRAWIDESLRRLGCEIDPAYQAPQAAAG